LADCFISRLTGPGSFFRFPPGVPGRARSLPQGPAARWGDLPLPLASLTARFFLFFFSFPLCFSFWAPPWAAPPPPKFQLFHPVPPYTSCTLFPRFTIISPSYLPHKPSTVSPIFPICSTCAPSPLISWLMGFLWVGPFVAGLRRCLVFFPPPLTRDFFCFPFSLFKVSSPLMRFLFAAAVSFSFRHFFPSLAGHFASRFGTW